MKTYEISKAEAGEFICEGYKAINWDSSTKGYSKFHYGKEGESLVGKFFTVDGDIEECKWGLHFSKDPAHVFNFYEPLGYNRYFKIRAYGKAVDATDGFKTVAQTIEFAEEYDLMEFIDVIKGFDRTGYGISCGYGIRDGYGINNGFGVDDGYGVDDGSGISHGFGIKNCKGVFNCAFCAGQNGIANRLFNKESTEARCDEVISKLRSFNWHPEFMNWNEVKGNKDWWAFCFPKLKKVDEKDAWAKMPKKMKDYIKSLPEFDAAVWEEITGANE